MRRTHQTANIHVSFFTTSVTFNVDKQSSGQTVWKCPLLSTLVRFFDRGQAQKVPFRQFSTLIAYFQTHPKVPLRQHIAVSSPGDERHSGKCRTKCNLEFTDSVWGLVYPDYRSVCVSLCVSVCVCVFDFLILIHTAMYVHMSNGICLYLILWTSTTAPLSRIKSHVMLQTNSQKTSVSPPPQISHDFSRR